MKVVLNGEQRELAANASVAEAVAATGADPEARGLAVAVEGEVLSRAQWPQRMLRDGESVEVVRAVQGG